MDLEQRHPTRRATVGRHEDAADFEPYRRSLEGSLGIPFTRGNRVDVLKNGVEIFPEMLAAIEAARSRIEFLTFVYWTGDIAVRFAETLARKAEAGVEVRVILDGVGARPIDPALLARMEIAGVEVVWFRPPVTWRFWRIDHRTHRKVLICDGEVAFTGGVGIAKEWEGDARNPHEWRDTHLRIEGPAVHGLRAAFLGNWAETGRPIPYVLEQSPEQGRPGDALIQVLRSTASIGWSDTATLIRMLFALARRSLHVTTAYFTPDDAALALLRQAAKRGVDVEIIMPGPHTDERVSQLAGEAEYGPLVSAGVKLWRYQPTMIHAKIVLVDGLIATLGSANFNQRSMRKDDEVSVTIHDPAVLARLEAQFREDRSKCEPVEARPWKRRGLIQRAKEAFAARVQHEV